MAESDTIATSAIAVHPGAWARLRPDLPPEVAAMVAPPITVSSAPVLPAEGPARARRRAELARYRANMPSVPSFDRHRRG